MPGASCPIDILASKDAAGTFVADQVEPLLKVGAVLGLDVDADLLPIYREWSRRHREQGWSFRGVTSFGLGEYEGLGRGDPRSCSRILDRALLSETNLGRCLMPPGLYRDAAAEAAAYERQIRAMGGFDLLLLGVGPGGRIAFNEPGSTRDSRCRRVALSPETREQAADRFGGPGKVPDHALTVGIETILDARRVVVVGWGSGAAARVRQALHGPVSETFPASFLQLHPQVRAVLAEVDGVWT